MNYPAIIRGGTFKMPAEIRLSGLFQPWFLIVSVILFAGSCTKDEYQPDSEADLRKAAGIYEVIPAHLADTIAINQVVSVTFKAGTEPSCLSEAVFTLRKGSIPVPGRTTISGTRAIFTPEKALTPETEYTACIKTGQAGCVLDPKTSEYSWNFKTGRNRHNSDLSVVLTDPLNKATGVPVGTMLTLTFNQELTSEMKNSLLIRLKEGQIPIDGSLSFSGTQAIFKPAKNLSPRTIYSVRVRIRTGVDTEDDKSSDSYFWSFITGGEVR